VFLKEHFNVALTETILEKHINFTVQINLMKKESILLLAAILISLIPSVHAQTEYTSGNQWANWQPLGIPPSEPYNPKIACDERGDICAVLWYEDNSLYRGVKLGISYDRLETTPTEQYTVTSTNFNPIVRGYYDYFNLPYDITYDSNSGKFRIFVSPNYVTYRYTYDSVNGLQSLSSIAYSCLSFGNESIMNCFNTSDAVSPDCEGYSNCVLVKAGFIDWNTLTFTETARKTELKGSQSYPCNRLAKFKGFMESTDTGTQIFDVKYDLEFDTVASCSGSSTITSSFKSMPSLTYDGLFYWDRSNYLYYRFTNTSNPSQNGVYRISTTDLSTYGTPEQYYAFNLTINEAINSSDFWRSGYEVYAYERETNSTQYPTGLWAYRQPVITISYISQYEIPTGEIYPIQNPASIKAQIECPDNYTYSHTGDSGFLYSKCYEPTVKLFSSDYLPPYYTTTINMTEDACQSAIFNILYTKRVNATIRVMDSFTGTPVSNATVMLGSQTTTTDSNGYAYFTNINALSNYDLQVTNPSSCYYEFNYYGDSKALSLSITKQNYTSYNDVVYIAKTNEQTGSLYFDTMQTVQIDPYSANLVIHVRTSDGKEITPSSAVVNISGTGDIYYIVPPKTKVNIHQGDFPQQWQVFGSGTVTLNIRLTYGEEEYSYTENVTIPSTKHIYLDINRSFNEQYCEDNEDCPVSECIGNTFKQLIGCIDNTCEYSNTECLICDSVAGCIDYPTDVECSTNLDCLNLSSCLSASRSRIGLCGDGGKCVVKTVTCPEGEICQNITIGGVYGYAFTCESSFLCAINDGTYLPFRIYKAKEYHETGSPSTELVLSVDYKCSMENINTKTCISGTTVTPPVIEGMPVGDIGIYTTPDNWQYSVNSTSSDYRFYDIAVTCHDSCNVTYEFCPYGCEDGECLQQPSSLENQARNMMQSITGYWYAMFPDIYSQTFIWLIISILTSVLIAGSLAYIGNFGGNDIGMVFVSVNMAMFLVGSFLGTMPFFVGVVFTILAGFIVWKLWSG